MLKNHGLITTGETCTWVFIRNVEVQLRAMVDGSAHPTDEVVMAHTREQFKGGATQGGAKVRHPEWPALVRLIDPKDPSWKR